MRFPHAPKRGDLGVERGPVVALRRLRLLAVTVAGQPLFHDAVALGHLVRDAPEWALHSAALSSGSALLPELGLPTSFAQRVVEPAPSSSHEPLHEAGTAQA